MYGQRAIILLGSAQPYLTQ